MPTEAYIYCGGTDDSSPISKESKKLQLNLGSGDDSNVKLVIEDICRPLIANIPPVLEDLLDIATYVYAADQFFRRGNSVLDDGESWRRKLHFHISVRDLEIWNDHATTSYLEKALNFLADEEYHFKFTHNDAPPSQQDYFTFSGVGTTYQEADSVMLFSGGLDSTAGLVHEVLEENNKPVLVSHRSAHKTNAPVKSLLDRFHFQHSNAKYIHIPVWASKSSQMSNEYTQRSRSFLYASLALVVARMFGLKTFKFYENGITSFNLPISPQILGARATRSTHPKAMRSFERLFTAITNQEIKILTPFIGLTKTDIVNKIGDNDCADLIEHTISCSHTMQKTVDYPHCGSCYQCVDRRFAIYGSKYAESESQDSYKMDLFLGEHTKVEDKTLAESYVKFASEIETIDQFAFFKKYPGLNRILSSIDGKIAEVAGNIFDLYKRHAAQVGRAVEKGIRQHSEEIRKNELSQSCLLNAILPSSRKPTKPEESQSDSQPTFRFDGETYEVFFNGEIRHLIPRKGYQYISILLDHPHEDLSSVDMFESVPAGRKYKIGRITLTNSKIISLEDDGKTGPIAIDHTVDDAVDKETIRQCRARLIEISQERTEPENMGNKAKQDAFDEEVEQIQKYLNGSQDIKGKPRKLSNRTEKARQSVRKAISDCIAHIKKVHPQFASHLEKYIHTGYFSKYCPPDSLNWVIE